MKPVELSVGEMDGSLFAPEFAYWNKSIKRK